LFINQLPEQINLSKHHRFDVKSEHVSPDQLRLLLDEEVEQFEIIPPQVRVKPHCRQTYQCPNCD